MAMQRRLAWLAVAAGVVATLPLGGCVALLAAGAGGGAVAYAENGGVANFYAFYPTSVSRVSAASRAAFGEMDIRYNGEIHKSPSKLLLEGTTQDGQTAKVTLTSMATDVTKANIRIGTLGDKPLSLQFQKLLSQRLGLAASAEAPAGTGLPPPSASSQPTAPQQPEQQTIPLQ
ncbi:MAG: DUF3568 family protein [Acidithiobacillus ferriphilus]|jgi:hypothetical protein|uniref:DUF3568 family protein n=3 Tax=Acidithiobacillus TaxID=119977 RepID=A0A179B6P9_ACIFR|nr:MULTISPECIES: DUF3568 family protein [Acidithiobacillus]MDA8182787.1 DUF3568 family protein [Acidithiobacillus sp.]OYV81738.1 MAG: hypothetical protein B7Z70_04575 [Acidithiobacillus ferrivorans]MBU2827549.1 DUF3568 family protein [Acidithiobacillus ferriphilus]MBU2830218.1 DUF3568 family protein [Acidithiobacillus ferriphilus]MBU2854306.1 DUF3568 family protein [Acidithiobacillus ferriphilus]